MALGLFEESFVQRSAHNADTLMIHRSDPSDRSEQSETSPDRAQQGYFRPLDRGSVGFLLLLMFLIGGLPAVSLAQTQAQQDVSQPMQELQDQWREIMKKEYNPSANQVMQPAARPTPVPTFEASQNEANTESGSMGSVNASGQSSHPTQEVREKSSSRTKRSAGSVGRTKSKSKRGSGRLSRSTAKTRGKAKASSSQPSRKAGRSGTAAKAQSNKTSTQSKTQTTPAKSVQAAKPAPGNKAAPVNKEKTETVKSTGSTQKKKAAVKAAASSQSVKKSGR